MQPFNRFQLPEDISILSTPAPGPPQNIIVQDCERDVCAPIQAVLSSAFLKMSAAIGPSPAANLAMPLEAYNWFGLPSVLLLGKAPKTTSFNYVALPAEGLETMFSRYGTTDDHDIAVNSVTSTVAVAAAGVTALPSLTLNADFIGPNFTALTAMRQFAILARITVPESVYQVNIAVTAPQSPIVEAMRIDFTDTECRELTFLLIQCGRTRSVVSYGTPNVASALTYQLPYNFTDVEAPASGAIETLTAAAFDDTGTQIAANFTIETFNVPYGMQLADAILPHKGIMSPGAQSVYRAGRATFAIESTQPLF